MSDAEQIFYTLIFDAVFLAVFAVLILGPLALVVAMTLVVGRSSLAAGAAAVVLGIAILYGYSLTPIPRMAIGALYFAVEPLRPSMVSLDLALSRGSRESVIQMVERGALPVDEHYGGYVMPAGSAGLSVYGNVDVIDDGCGRRYFWMTLTGFSPDPYSGFEFVPAGCHPEVDPEGSGDGIARPLGDGWFWIQAS